MRSRGYVVLGLVLSVSLAGCVGATSSGWTFTPARPGSASPSGGAPGAIPAAAHPSASPEAPEPSSADASVPAEDAGTPVSATEAEFKIVLGSSTVPAGALTFSIANKGAIAHEFVIARSDDVAGALPTADDTTVDEESESVVHITETEDIQPSTVRVVTTRLSPGRYVVFCNIPGHYAAGMHASFTVVASDNW